MSTLRAHTVKDMLSDLAKVEDFLRSIAASSEIPAERLGTARALVVTTRRRLLEAAITDVEIAA